MFNSHWKMLVALFVVFVATAQGQVPAVAQIGNSEKLPVTSNNNMVENMDDPVEVISTDGQFSMWFPAGCPRVRTVTPSNDPGGSLPFVYVFCDRNNEKGEGYSVTTWFDVAGPNGKNPGMPELMEKMEDALARLKVVIVKQVPMEDELPGGIKMKGMDLLAHSPDSIGQAWFRGWVVESRIYLIVAFRSAGDLLTQPGLKDFFNSFQPG